MSAVDCESAYSAITIPSGIVCLPLEFMTITEFFRKKADTELNETAEKKRNCLRILKSIIEAEEKNLRSNLDDAFLLRFLRAKKFDCRRAFCLLKKYYSYRAQCSHLFEGFSPTYVIPSIESNFMNFLPYRTPAGCAIWLVRIGLWNPDILSLNDLMKFGFTCMEKAAENPVTQICGVVSILDCEGLAWKHVSKITPASLRCFVAGIQDSFPLRQKEVHIVNNYALFGLIFTFLRSFLSSKIRNRIFFHGGDMRDLHRSVPPEILPQELKGHLGPFKNSRFYDSLLKSEETFLDNQKFGYRTCTSDY